MDHKKTILNLLKVAAAGAVGALLPHLTEIANGLPGAYASVAGVVLGLLALWTKPPTAPAALPPGS